MRMSDETRKRLIEAEQQALQGKRELLNTEELTSVFTDIAAEKLSSLTDDEIAKSVNVYHSTPEGEFSPSYSAKWGFLQKETFVNQLKTGRAMINSKDETLRSDLRSMIESEIKERADYLKEALPETFGQIDEQGVTPLKVVVIAYSIAADDPLSDSSAELKDQMAVQRTYLRQTRLQRQDSGKPFGVNGFFFSAPSNTIFNSETINDIVNRTEGGEKQ